MLKYFSLWTGDFLSDIALMPTVATGAHIKLMAISAKHGSLLDDDRELARVAGVTAKEWRTIRQHLEKLWTIENGVWSLFSLEEQRVKAESTSEKRREAGRIGGIKSIENRRYGNQEIKQLLKQEPRQMPEQEVGFCSGISDPEPEPEPEPKRERGSLSGDRGPGEYPPDQCGDQTVVRLLDADDAQWAFDLYNQTAEAHGLPKARDLTDERRRKIRQRIKDHGRAGWEEAIGHIARSRFLRGEIDGKTWKADLAFFLQKESFLRVIEGRYDDRAGSGTGPGKRHALRGL